MSRALRTTTTEQCPTCGRDHLSWYAAQDCRARALREHGRRVTYVRMESTDGSITRYGVYHAHAITGYASVEYVDLMQSQRVGEILSQAFRFRYREAAEEFATEDWPAYSYSLEK